VTGGGFHVLLSRWCYIGGPTALLLLLSLVFEQPAVLTTGLALVLAKPGLYFAAFSAALQYDGLLGDSGTLLSTLQLMLRDLMRELGTVRAMIEVYHGDIRMM
jgi:hypothetical protein